MNKVFLNVFHEKFKRKVFFFLPHELVKIPGVKLVELKVELWEKHTAHVDDVAHMRKREKIQKKNVSPRS